MRLTRKQDMTEDLYRHIILEHSDNPHNYGVLEQADATAEAINRLCGDKVTVFLQASDGVIEGAQFVASACAIVKASASLMTDAVRYKTPQDIIKLVDTVREFLQTRGDGFEDIVEEYGKALGDIRALEGVRAYPARLKCALLPWSALSQAIESLLEHTGQS